jgi:uncharacterized peroxidase-related enzyme
VVHHGRGLAALLRQAGRPASEKPDHDEEGEQDIERLTRALATDYRTASLAPEDRALLDYADKLTRTPGAMSVDDVGALRAHGFDDRAIHDLCAVVAYFNFVNRTADGLGVELE